MKYNPIKKLKTTAIIPTEYMIHCYSNPPKNDDIKTAVATYLATSINHLPISLRISKIFSTKVQLF